jgi:signal transduction histidine kinase
MESEARLRQADGEYRWFLIRNVPLRDESGNIVKWYGTSIDIEDRKQAEDALRQSGGVFIRSTTIKPHRQLQLEGSQWRAPVVGGDLSNLPTRASGEDHLVELAFQRAHPEDAPGVKQVVARASQDGEDFDFEHRLLMPDGSVKYVHVVAHGERGESGELEFVGAVMDVTAVKEAEGTIKRAEEALRQAQADLAHVNRVTTMGELAASLAHEVNQPLSAIAANGHACLRWLSADPPNLARAREAAERIIRDGQDAGEIVRRVRALFRRAPGEKDVLDLNEVIGEVLRLLRGDVRKKRHRRGNRLGQGTSIRGGRSYTVAAGSSQPGPQWNRGNGSSCGPPEDNPYPLGLG